MKPDTLNVFTNLAIEEVKEDMKALSDAAENEELDSSRYRDAAQACRNMIEVMEALENLYLTAADELDAVIMGVDLAAEAILFENSEVVAIEKIRMPNDFIQPWNEKNAGGTYE